MEYIWELLDKYLLILARLSGFLFTAPVFGSIIIPLRVKTGLTIVFGVVFLPILAKDIPPLPPLGIEFILILLGELLFGILLGFIPFLFILIFQTSAEFYSIPMGFGITTAIDPLAQIEQPLISQFLGLTGLLIFLSLDFHHLLIQTLVDSYKYISPPGLNLEDLSFTTTQLISAMSFIFYSALKIAMPLLAVLFLANLALGLLSKAAPLLNILILGWPFTILAGLITLLILLPLFISAGINLFEKLAEDLHYLIIRLK